MKDVELKLIAELMKNSRRSDRELAKAIGVSQPTISRLIKKLEKEGCVKEYTMIPDFTKLGYSLLGLIFVKLRKELTSEETEKAREIARQSLKASPFGIIMLERGMGLGYDGVIICFYDDYTAYTEHRNLLKDYSFFDPSSIHGFLIDLNDEVRYHPLSFATLANLLMELREKNKHGASAGL